MNNLDKNILKLWRLGDVPERSLSWLCMKSFRSVDIHISIRKDSISGVYVASCLDPKLEIKLFDLRLLLERVFTNLDKLTTDVYHRSTLRRVLPFIEQLKVSPDLFEFNEFPF